MLRNTVGTQKSTLEECPVCHCQGRKTSVSSRRVWKIKDVKRIKGKIGPLGIGQILERSKDAPLEDRLVKGERITIRRGKRHEYYRFRHYDGDLYQKQAADFDAGIRKSRPTGDRWCYIGPNHEIDDASWSKIYKSVPLANQYYIQIFEGLLKINKSLEYVFFNSLSPSDRTSFQGLFVLSRRMRAEVKHTCLNLLPHYIIPRGEDQHLRHEIDTIVSDVENLKTDVIKSKQAGKMFDFRRVILYLILRCQKSCALLFTFIADYFMKHYKYKEEFSDEIDEHEFMIKIVEEHVTSKTRGKILRGRIKGKLPIEPDREAARKLGFADIQCMNCSGWRVSEIKEQFDLRSWKCWACDSIMRKELKQVSS